MGLIIELELHSPAVAAFLYARNWVQMALDTAEYLDREFRLECRDTVVKVRILSFFHVREEEVEIQETTHVDRQISPNFRSTIHVRVQ